MLQHIFCRLYTEQRDVFFRRASSMVFYDLIKLGSVNTELCTKLIDVDIVHIVVTHIVQYIGKVAVFKAFLPLFFLPVKA